MKDKFWKICAVIFLILLFLHVWVNRFSITKYGGVTVKMNKLTGKTYEYFEPEKGWIELKKQ